MSTTTPNMLALIRDAQKQALATLEQFQQASLKAAEAGAALAPAEPWPGFANAKPTELVEASFAFYGQVLESQKAFALRLAGMAAEAATDGTTKAR